MNGKTPLLLTILLFILALGWLRAVQPYSAPSRWSRYDRVSRQFLHAAVRQDSVELTRQSATIAPVIWALHAARLNPRALEVWSRYGHPAWGVNRADTAIVYLETFTDVCSRSPIVLRFLDQAKHPRVIQASSACFEAP